MLIHISFQQNSTKMEWVLRVLLWSLLTQLSKGHYNFTDENKFDFDEKEGDICFAYILPITKNNEIVYENVQRAEIFKKIINEINQRDDILPNITLGQRLSPLLCKLFNCNSCCLSDIINCYFYSF